MVNFVVCQDFGLEFFAKAKPLRPRPKSQGQGQFIARPRPQNLALRPRPRPRTNITGKRTRGRRRIQLIENLLEKKSYTD